MVIQELESAANEAVADVQNEINEKRRLEDENKKLQVSENSLENLRILTFIAFNIADKFNKISIYNIKDERAMLMRKLENEQGDLQQYREREGKAAAQKAELEVQLEENKDKLEHQSDERVKLTYEKEGLEHEVNNIKKDVTELEERIGKAEAEKTSRDHAMRQLNDEIANQDEIISKLNKVIN